MSIYGVTLSGRLVIIGKYKEPYEQFRTTNFGVVLKMLLARDKHAP